MPIPITRIPRIRGAACNLYQTLNVPHTAKDAEIRRAIKKLIIKTHPDRNSSRFHPFLDTVRNLVIKTEEILADPVKRKSYDYALSKAMLAAHGDVYTDFASINNAIKTVQAYTTQRC